MVYLVDLCTDDQAISVSGEAGQCPETHDFRGSKIQIHNKIKILTVNQQNIAFLDTKAKGQLMYHQSSTPNERKAEPSNDGSGKNTQRNAKPSLQLQKPDAKKTRSI